MKKIKVLSILFCICMFTAIATCCNFGGNKGDNSSNASSNTAVTVSFDPCADGYSGLRTNTPLAQNLSVGDLVKEPVIRAISNPENYQCDGWYTSMDYTTKWDFETDTVTESMTLYALWVKGYTVNYYLTDGEMTELKQYNVTTWRLAMNCSVIIPMKRLQRNTISIRRLQAKQTFT